MANPTTGKPSGPFRQWTSTAATVGELLRCYDPLLEDGPERDVVGKVLAKPWLGIAGHGTGHAAARIAAGFDGGGLSEASYRFTAGSCGICYPGRGWTTTTLPAVPSPGYTFFAVIKPETAPGPVVRNIPVFGNGSMVVGMWVAYQIALDGTITLGRMTNSNSNFFNPVFTSASITLVSGRWYLIAMSPTSTTQAIWQVYDYTSQAFVTVEATGNTVNHVTPVATPGPAITAGSDAIINPGACFNTHDIDAFLGEVAAFGLSATTWNPATNAYFAAMVADPWTPARTADAGGGALTAKGVVNRDETTSGIHLRANLPEGGTAGAKQVRWHRSTVPSFTPDVATRLSSLGANWEYEDTTALARINYWYKAEFFDGTTTVYSTASADNDTQVPGRISRGDFFFGVSSDSRWVNTQGHDVTRVICATLRAAGLRAGLRNCGLASSRIKHATASLSWQPNTTQDPTNGQAGTTLLENLLAWMDLDGLTTILSESGVTDASTDSLVTILANLEIITDYIVSEGKRIVLVKPYQSLSGETRSLRIHELSTSFDLLDNGSTVRSLRRNNYDHSCSTASNNQVDQIHPAYVDLEGIAVATAILETFFPEGTGGVFTMGRG